MQRNSSTPAVVLSLKPLGENNSSVTILTPTDGISYVTLYGGPKSKMRSLVSQWHSGTIWLYENKEKNQTKISDFEVTNYHTSFGQNLFKLYAASLAAELAIKTKCAGSNEKCFNLVSGFLDGMELCTEEQSRVGLLRFLWRYLELLGVQPEANVCGHCGESFLEGKFAPDSISYYNSIENCFICNSCFTSLATDSSQKSTVFPVKNAGVIYLAAVQVLPPSEVRKLQIDKETFEQLKQIVFHLIQVFVDQKLNSIETGMGIL